MILDTLKRGMIPETGVRVGEILDIILETTDPIQKIAGLIPKMVDLSLKIAETILEMEDISLDQILETDINIPARIGSQDMTLDLEIPKKGISTTEEIPKTGISITEEVPKIGISTVEEIQGINMPRILLEAIPKIGVIQIGMIPGIEVTPKIGGTKDGTVVVTIKITISTEGKDTLQKIARQIEMAIEGDRILEIIGPETPEMAVTIITGHKVGPRIGNRITIRETEAVVLTERTRVGQMDLILGPGLRAENPPKMEGDFIPA
jgi:hypothetical protein